MNMITTSDSLQFIKGKKDYEFNIIYADPPYALGSEIYIRPDGKVDYSKAADFMSKWEMPTGEYWEQWFKEAFRTLKYGGYLILFGIDRQTLLFKYYASLAGFTEKQSLYWYFISNFPKATDLSKMIDKQAGVERETIAPSNNARPNSLKENNLYDAGTVGKEFDLTAPSTDLAKKYDGYKYSIAPLKQTNETIMVFMKPTKTGSPLHDTLAYESGDDSINVSALDIDGNRVGTTDELGRDNTDIKTSILKPDNGWNSNSMVGLNTVGMVDGRYPSQTFIDNEAAQVIDEQSDIKVGSSTMNKLCSPSDSGIYNWNKDDDKPTDNVVLDGYNDIGGASKILHKCKFEQDDLTLYYYEPKVGNGERNAGLGGFEKKLSAASEFRPNHLEKTLQGENGNPYGRWKPLQNNHPTLKPIDLNYRILKLFKTPNPQSILYPFAGSGSEIIGGIKAGFDNWVGCEINPEYVEIANARIKYWRENMYEQQSLFEEAI